MTVVSYKWVLIIKKHGVPWTHLRVAWLILNGVVEKDDVLMLICEELCPLFNLTKHKPREIEISGIHYRARADDIWISVAS